jgi:hypothetical protein
LSYRNSNPLCQGFFGNLFFALLAVFNAEVKGFFDVGKALVIGFTLGVSFRDKRAACYVETVGRFADYNRVFHIS